MDAQTVREVKAYLLAHVTREPGGCWLWKGGVDRRGYARLRINGRVWRAARASHRAFVGPIPHGHDIHHVCQNRRCINPAHLRPMPHGAHLRLHAASGAWRGERNSMARLCERDVQFIKVARPYLSAHDLAREFGIGIRNVYHIWSGGGWPHVTRPTFPPRSLREVRRDCQAIGRRALDTFLNVQQGRRERGIPEPPSLDHCITLARACAGLYCVRGGG